MTRVKTCGLTRLEDARKAHELGAWALGFIFYPKSPRRVDAQRVADIVDALPAEALPVLVFVNASREEIERTVSTARLLAVQLHGDETPEFCASLRVPVIKALRARSRADIEAAKSYSKLEALLIEAAVEGAYGGTGQLSDWTLAKEAKLQHRVLLSGGLNAANVGEGIRVVRPFGVDVSSGVENAPGVKDAQKLEQLFAAVRAVDGVKE